MSIISFSIFIIHHQTLLTNIAGVTGSKDNVDEDALNEELDERLDDRLNHVQQLLVRPMVLPPITLDKMRYWDNMDLVKYEEKLYQRLG